MDEAPKKNNENSLHSNDYWIQSILILFRWKKILVASVLFVSILTAIYTLTLDKWYESTAVVILPEKTVTSFDFLSGNLSGLGASLLGAGGSTSRYLAILNSRRLREKIVEKYQLKDVFHTKDVEGALKILEDNLIIEQDKKLGNINVTMRCIKDPQMTAEMANFAVEKLDEINRELGTEQARYARQFIEERYKQARVELKATEDSLNVFQKKYGVVALNEQTRASIEAAANIQVGIANLETEINVKKKVFGNNHPDLLKLESELNELKKVQQKMDYGDLGVNVFIPFKNAPDLGLKYLRLYRDVQINNKIVEFLVPQYEQAKIQEARDTPTLLVLDKAKPALYPFKPRKTIITIVTGIISFLLIAASIVIYELKIERYLKQGLKLQTLITDIIKHDQKV